MDNKQTRRISLPIKLIALNKETALECKNHDTKKVFNGHQSEYMSIILKDIYRSMLYDLD